MRYVASKRSPLTVRSHSKKPLQKCHPKRPSDKAIAHSAQGRLATHSHFATHLAGQRLSCSYKSALRCASLSAHESGIFELLRQLYPARLLFFAVEKKEGAARRRHRRSPRITGNQRGGRPKRLRRATHDLYGTSVPHSALMGGRIRKNKNQMGISYIRSSHSLREHFALDDLVRGTAAVHFEPRKCPSAFWAVHIAAGMVFGDAIYNALHQPTAPAFAVFVQQGFAFRATDRNGPNVFACHGKIER